MTSISALLERCKPKSTRLNKDKVALRVQKLDFMGHLLTAQDLKPDPYRVKAILKLETPKTKEDKELVIQCDATTLGLAAALIQEGRPLAHASKVLTEPETPYATIEKEMLAIVFLLAKWHQFVYVMSRLSPITNRVKSLQENHLTEHRSAYRVCFSGP